MLRKLLITWSLVILRVEIIESVVVVKKIIKSSEDYYLYFENLENNLLQSKMFQLHNLPT